MLSILKGTLLLILNLSPLGRFSLFEAPCLIFVNPPFWERCIAVNRANHQLNLQHAGDSWCSWHRQHVQSRLRPQLGHLNFLLFLGKISLEFQLQDQVADYNGRYIQPQIQIQMEDQVRPVAELEYNRLYMLVSSNQPGVQFYTGNFLPRLAI